MYVSTSIGQTKKQNYSLYISCMYLVATSTDFFVFREKIAISLLQHIFLFIESIFAIVFLSNT